MTRLDEIKQEKTIEQKKSANNKIIVLAIVAIFVLSSVGFGLYSFSNQDTANPDNKLPLDEEKSLIENQQQLLFTVNNVASKIKQAYPVMVLQADTNEPIADKIDVVIASTGAKLINSGYTQLNDQTQISSALTYFAEISFSRDKSPEAFLEELTVATKNVLENIRAGLKGVVSFDSKQTLHNKDFNLTKTFDFKANPFCEEAYLGIASLKDDEVTSNLYVTFQGNLVVKCVAEEISNSSAQPKPVSFSSQVKLISIEPKLSFQARKDFDFVFDKTKLTDSLKAFDINFILNENLANPEFSFSALIPVNPDFNSSTSQNDLNSLLSSNSNVKSTQFYLDSNKLNAFIDLNSLDSFNEIKSLISNFLSTNSYSEFSFEKPITSYDSTVNLSIINQSAVNDINSILKNYFDANYQMAFAGKLSSNILLENNPGLDVSDQNSINIALSNYHDLHSLLEAEINYYVSRNKVLFVQAQEK